MSETQKYGHVTFFWNGNRSGRFDEDGETYIEVPSDILPFEERPWMRAAEITDAVIRQLESGSYRHARLNYANGDMVGHTGRHEPTIQAVEAVDLQIGRLIPVIERLQGALIVTRPITATPTACSKSTKRRARSATTRTAARCCARATPSTPCRSTSTYRATNLASTRPSSSPPSPTSPASVLHLMGLRAPEDYRPSLLAD